MAIARSRPMTVAEFLDWAAHRPEGERYELLAGEVVPMSPERNRHTLVKSAIFRALDRLAERSGCIILQDGATVVVDETTAFEPDVTVQCGQPLDLDALTADAPTILVEVISPTSQGIDTGRKFEGYFRLASVRHYLVVDPDRRSVIHHHRGDGGAITSRVCRSGRLDLPPLGEVADVAAFFPKEPRA